MAEYKLKNERETLMKVRDDLANSKITHENFNMSVSCEQRYNCGTVACIGGHAWLTENPQDFTGASVFVNNIRLNSEQARLYDLFYGNTSEYVRPEEAVIAIDNYLAGKYNVWQHISFDEAEAREEQE